MPQRLTAGIDSFLLRRKEFGHQRLALVTNNAATNSTGILSRVAMMTHQFNLIRLFSPEHGITVKGDDGVRQRGGEDVETGLPVTSLYSEKLSPDEDDLRDVDLVLFDIPDVGCRFYTYLWTMTHVMEACARVGKRFVVLDRPNPIGALLENAEGPMLDEVHCASFIGRWNIPLKHCCTLGELASYFAATRMPSLQLDVVKVVGYHRHQTAWDDFAFMPTSPAIQDIHTAMLYPGTGLWEGIWVNEGRGTGNPFSQFGAPWINGKKLCDALQSVLQHLRMEQVEYMPSSGVYANEICHGMKFYITNPADFKAVSTGITILQILFNMYPDMIEERLYTTHANPNGARHLDKLLGYENAFDKLKNQESPFINIAEDWKRTMTPYLLY